MTRLTLLLTAALAAPALAHAPTARPTARAATAAPAARATTTATPAARTTASATTRRTTTTRAAPAPAGRMVTAKLANGRTVTYNCSLPGNATKQACRR